MNNKKVTQFLNSNFPPYSKCTIIEEKNDKTVAILTYGRNEKIRVTIGIGSDDYSVYRLLQTDFL